MKFSSNVEFEKYTTTARDARVAVGKMPVGSVIENTTTGTVQWRKNASTWLDIGAAPGASLTPVAYQANPTLASLRDAMVQFGGMSPQPTYQVSGQITGTGNDNVALALVGTITYNTTTDGSGNFSFPAVVDGSYTLTPTKAGYYTTPASRSVVVAGADMTGQNFTIAVSTSSATTSATKVYIPQISAVNRLRSVQKSPRALNAELYPGVAVNCYTPTYHNGRLFLPTATGIVLVYDDNDVLRATINPGIGAQIFAVHAVGTKLLLVGSTHIQFGTYTNGSPDVWTAGNKVANSIYPQDSTLFNGEVWITGTYSASPTPHNVVRYNVNTEAMVRSNIFAGTANLLAICAGDTTIAVQNTTNGTIRIIDPATLATIGAGSLNAASNPNNMAFSRGKFWITFGGNLFALTPSGNTAIPPGFAASGCVADADFVYVFNNAQTGLVVVDADLNTVNGSTVSGLSAPAYYIQ